MKEQCRRIILSVLAMMPVASISLAATSELSTEEGEVQKGLLLGDALKLKTMLFPDLETYSTIDAAYERFRKTSGIEDKETLNAEFRRALRVLQENNLLQMDEKYIASKVASGGGGGWGGGRA